MKLTKEDVKDKLEKAGYTFYEVTNPDYRMVGKWCVYGNGETSIYFACLHDVMAWFKKEAQK